MDSFLISALAMIVFIVRALIHLAISFTVLITLAIIEVYNEFQRKD